MAADTRSMQPTRQQQAVVDACVSGANLVIEAGAGTGKTSTLQLAAATMTGRTGLYVAYNRATALAARRSFPPSVHCVTAHALAYSAIGFRYAHRLSGRGRHVPAWQVANLLGIGEPMLLGDKLILTAAHQARITMATIERFCYSADAHVSGSHVPPVNGLDSTSHAELTWRIVPYAERAWHDIGQTGGRLPFRHDHYLKMWQLSQPVISADFIMFDEAQDANPVTASIVQRQRDVQQIAVGDSCQAIYGWRGAVDALATWPASQRLQLTHSFRFGTAVATEANKWLLALGSPFRLSGTPRIASVVGAVTNPHAILCRTNAEALEQARFALDNRRRAALAGGGADIRLLAMAALELKATGHTSNPDLAAFTSWQSVQGYIRTDSAGADLAASIRLIDRHGPAMILRTIEQLSSEARADVVVSTAHRAKGQEWGRVLVAPDFREPKSGKETPGGIPRTDAMLAYVAVTRARDELDRGGLAWIDNHPGRPSAGHAVTRLETKMLKPVIEPQVKETEPQDQLSEPRPYEGGRAQAESGSLIIQNDFDAWILASSQPDTAMPADHPRVVQLTQAWWAVTRHGLGDDPAAAATRYQVLAHAALALTETAGQDGRSAEVAALGKLTDHAKMHASRLQATADEMFLHTGKAGPYDGGRAQAASGSRIVEKDYLAWAGSPAAAQAASDPGLWTHAKRLQQAWDEIRSRGLADGAGPAAARYAELAEASRTLAGDFTPSLPSPALTGLLQLAGHARKHSIRLQATAASLANPGQSQDSQEVSRAAAGGDAYRGLPVHVASVSASAHSGQPVPDHRSSGHTHSGRDIRRSTRTGPDNER
jgi:AAA domain/UvrD-like helicase C-terminal domain